MLLVQDDPKEKDYGENVKKRLYGDAELRTHLFVYGGLFAWWQVGGPIPFRQLHYDTDFLMILPMIL